MPAWLSAYITLLGPKLLVARPERDAFSFRRDLSKKGSGGQILETSKLGLARFVGPRVEIFIDNGQDLDRLVAKLKKSTLLKEDQRKVFVFDGLCARTCGGWKQSRER